MLEACVLIINIPVAVSRLETRTIAIVNNWLYKYLRWLIDIMFYVSFACTESGRMRMFKNLPTI